MSLAGCQINPIDVNFHLQKSLEIFDKDSADKIWSKKDKGWKVPSLMPIRVKQNWDKKLDYWSRLLSEPELGVQRIVLPKLCYLYS